MCFRGGRHCYFDTLPEKVCDNAHNINVGLVLGEGGVSGLRGGLSLAASFTINYNPSTLSAIGDAIPDHKQLSLFVNVSLLSF